MWLGFGPMYKANFNEHEADIIVQVCQKYGHLTGIQLSSICHAKGTPWDQIHNSNLNLLTLGTSSIIPNSLIMDYYKAMLEKYESKQEVDYAVIYY